jgi:undecaprenyl-diphosphatase
LSVREVTQSIPHHVTKGRSFTSGHACNNVALAMVGCAIFGWRAVFLWPWAALVSYSRIYVGAHYPSDILGSWLVALIYSFLILKAAEFLWQKHAPNRWPHLYEAHPVLFPSWRRVLRVAA